VRFGHESAHRAARHLERGHPLGGGEAQREQRRRRRDARLAESPRTWRAEIVTLAITPMAIVSGDPASTGAATMAPQATASRRRPERSARSAARAHHGIQAAPARWFQRLTSDANGPPAIQAMAATAAAGHVSPRRRASSSMPAPESAKWTTTNSV